MPKLRAIILCLACVWGPVFAARAAQPTTNQFVIEGEGLAFDFNTGDVTYTNNPVVRYGNAVLSAQKARLNRDSGDIVAEGTVRLQQDNEVWFGERIQYNFKTRKILATDFRAGQPPYFTKGSALSGDENANVYVLTEGIVTTDDYAEPGYHIRTSSLTISPGDYIEARD